jgi:hypothetical protein
VRQVCGGEVRAPGAAKGTTLSGQSSASWRCSSRRFFASLLNKPQFHAITADMLFILILVELFRLLNIDLQQQRVAVRGGDKARLRIAV